MKKCVIVGALDCKILKEDFTNDTLFIAADAGYKTMKKCGIVPHLAVGDFDSSGEIPTDTEVIRHPIRKDDTDLMLAVKTALQKGYGSFYIFGCLGGRLDQTVASIQTLYYLAQSGADGVLCSDDECITVVKDSSLSFKESAKGTMSVFALDGIAQGVTLQNLSYPLSDATVEPAFPIGVSNEFLQNKQATVKVTNGALAVIWNGSYKDIKERKPL